MRRTWAAATQLRELSDFKGDELVSRVIELVDEHKPLHVSLVGGDPLVRHRELDILLFRLAQRGVHTQVVTSAFRRIPGAWMKLKNLNVVISVDGLQPEHDARRKPATYERILANIARDEGHDSLHHHRADRGTSAATWTNFFTSGPARPEVNSVWFSLFTPQRGATDPEILSQSQRASVVADLRQLRKKYPALEMPESLIREIESPPKNPDGVHLCPNDQNHLRRSGDARFLPASSAATLIANSAAALHPWPSRRSGIAVCSDPITAGHLFRDLRPPGRAMETASPNRSSRPASEERRLERPQVHSMS